ncbi:MAG: glycosyl transferase [Opitutus sp.]|nr:glycosyl transferase [Opitutus sp.]
MLTNSLVTGLPVSFADYAALASPWGRWRLSLRSRLQQKLWRLYCESPSLTKRAMDVAVSGAALLGLAPLFLLIALLIKLEDGGPVFFMQTRVGKHGRKFRMFKFRSMCLNAEQKLRELAAQNQHATGVTFKIKRDPRITRVGRWLRKLSFDELPQFYNVLRGEMSVVGPRPPVPGEVAKYTQADRRRLAVKPGITCIWQVSGRAEIDFPGQVRLDVNYIERQCLAEDVRILFKTVPAVISGKGAY